MYQSHRSFILRLVIAALVVDVVFAVTDFFAFFSSPMTFTQYQMAQTAFPVSVVLAVILASYFLVFKFVPHRLRLVASLVTLIAAAVFGFLLGVVFFFMQLLPVAWLNGAFWPNGMMLGMSLSATIALYLFPALAYALAATVVAYYFHKLAPRPKSRAKSRRRARA